MRLPESLAALWSRLRARPRPLLAADAVFWALLVGLLVALLAPLARGTMPPAQDFGGHLSMADIWARYDRQPLFREFFLLRNDLSPNALHVRFVRLVFPLLSPLPALKLFFVGSLVGFVAAFLYVLHVFERSRWLVFPALVFLCWGNMVTLGLVNNVAIFPWMFLGVALAKRAAERATAPWFVALGVTLLLAYFSHGIAFGYALAMALGMVVLHVRSARGLWSFLSFVPALSLWIWWIKSTQGRRDMPGTHFKDALAAPGTRILKPEEALIMFEREALELMVSHRRTVVVIVVLAAFVIGLALTVPLAARVYDQKLAGARAALRELHDLLTEHALLWMAVCLSAGLLILPYELMGMPISPRLTTVVAVTWMLVPRVPPGSWRAAAPAAIGVVASVLWVRELRPTARALENEEYRPMRTLLEKIPERGKRVVCVGARWAQPHDTYRQPLGHNCYGLAQVVADAFVGTPFALTDYNAVYFRPEVRDHVPDIENVGWATSSATLFWDYLLVRGDHPQPSADRFTRIDSVRYPTPGAPLWTLYRVDHGPTRAMGAQPTAGGPGGFAMRVLCPEGEEVRGLRVSSNASMMQGVRALCGRVSGGDLRATQPLGAAIGTDADLRCEQGRIVGLHGRAALMVDAVGPLCDAGSADGPVAGGPGGHPFHLSCPPGKHVIGLTARAAAMVDSLGPICEP